MRFWGFLVMGLIWTGGIATYALSNYAELLPMEKFISLVVVAPGLGLLVASAHAGLALFNPVVDINVSDGIKLGTTFQLQWRLHGRRVDKLDRLLVKLEGLEEVHEEGTEQRFEQYVFYSETIINARGREAIEGETSVDVPPIGLPSFAATRHRVIWRFTVEGFIPSWPNIVDEFVLSVKSYKRGAT